MPLQERASNVIRWVLAIRYDLHGSSKIGQLATIGIVCFRRALDYYVQSVTNQRI